MNTVLTEKELSVCKKLYEAVCNRRGICDPTDFSDEEDQIFLDLQEKGCITNDVNCIVLKKEFKDFLEGEFGGK